LLGAVCSILTSYMFKNFQFGDFPWIEVGMFGMCSYLPYILAEYLELSGILAIFVTGLMLRDYTFYSLSACGKITVEFFVETAGFISENFIFAYLGISIPLMWSNFNWQLVLIGCIALVVSRTASVMIVSLFVNCFKKEKIPFSHQIVMSYAGLRGAVAFYLALNVHNSSKHLVIMTTMCLIMFTIIGMGSTTTCLLSWLNKVFPDDEILQEEEEIRLSDDEGDDDHHDKYK
jgi:NhaP-type Na+/H+ or K+/H+ antiporter